MGRNRALVTVLLLLSLSIATFANGPERDVSAQHPTRGDTIFEMDMNVSEVSEASFIGEDAGDLTRRISGAGDVNNDGYDDILIGSNMNSGGGSHSGQTYLILGRSGGWTNLCHEPLTKNRDDAIIHLGRPKKEDDHNIQSKNGYNTKIALAGGAMGVAMVPGKGNVTHIVHLDRACVCLEPGNPPGPHAGTLRPGQLSSMAVHDPGLVQKPGTMAQRRGSFWH